jgi:hypothetical protein
MSKKPLSEKEKAILEAIRENPELEKWAIGLTSCSK